MKNTGVGAGLRLITFLLRSLVPTSPALRTDTLGTPIESSEARKHGSRIAHDRRHSLRGLFRNQQILRKRPLAIDPLRVAAKSRARRHLRNFFGLVFVRDFRPDRF